MTIITFSSYHSSEQLTFFLWCSCVYCTASCFTGYGKQVQLAEHLQKASATKSVLLRYEISSTKNHLLVCLGDNLILIHIQNLDAFFIVQFSACHGRCISICPLLASNTCDNGIESVETLC